MTEVLTRQKFEEWATTVLQQDKERAIKLWDSIKLSEDLLNHFLELPFRNQTHILTNLGIMVDPALLGVFYRSAVSVQKLYPEQFNIESMALSSPVDFFSPSIPSKEYVEVRADMAAKLDSFDNKQKNKSWRDKGLKIAVFELMRALHSDELLIQVMKACLNLDTEVPMQSIAKILDNPQVYSEYPTEWAILSM